MVRKEGMKMPNEAKDGVIWEVSLDSEWVRRYLDTHAQGWKGTNEELERIMWAIFDFVGGEMDDFVKNTTAEFLSECSNELGIPNKDYDDD